MGNYKLQDNTYIIEGFDTLPPFSSFLPGLAGRKGIPLWVYYTNRGQGINSFGIHNKGNAIMEFNPANTAYENTSVKGFRTFIKCNGSFFEPFHTLDDKTQRDLYIRKNSFWMVETNHRYNLRITVKYFVLPNNSIGALVRKVTIENLDEEVKELELLDGLPKIIPYGILNSQYKEMSNLLKSWTEIKNIKQGIPYYTMRGSSDDSAEVSEMEGGYYYLAVRDGRIQPVIYDAEVIFDYETSLLHPVVFERSSLQGVLGKKQCYYNKVPCGFTPMKLELQPGKEEVFFSLTGYAGSIEQVNNKSKEFCSFGFLERNEGMAEELAEALTADIRTHTGVSVFDQYMEQNYLDNFLRGGYPFVFEKDGKKSVIHLFSRKHGDPERDYNFFSIAGEYYSQGNGNFRDVNQNRRNDVFFHPEIGDFNIKTFYELIQIDGYNPLEVRPSTFRVMEGCHTAAEQLILTNVKNEQEKLIKLISRNFTPGQISNCIAANRIELVMDEDQLLDALLFLCDQNIEAGFVEGYWSDHWVYNLDLVENYLSIFPEMEKKLLFEDSSYRFYDSPARVLPRSEKYVLNKKQEVRQYGALVHDEEKLAMEGFDQKGTNWKKTEKGDFVRTTLAGKLLTLAVNKFSSLDPYGMGVEMEAGKPGWNDAMNGLPGLFGSGMAETFELKRMLVFLRDRITLTDQIVLPAWLTDFLTEVYDTLRRAEEQQWTEFAYWDTVSTIRENFREKVRFTVGDEVQGQSTQTLKNILEAFLNKLEQGIKKACSYGDGIVPTYFTYRAAEFEPVLSDEGQMMNNSYGLPKVKVKAFEVMPLPAFLEGPAKMLATVGDREQAEELYRKVRSSRLFDEKLEMYKTSVPIEHISMENGRIRAFTPGWLERESIFLHMEYKYLLSTLRAGLYERFYEDMKTCMIIFRDPKEYGRSILENSSFLASGENPNADIHGRGYVARLTGSTTEAITMWIEMFIGRRVFTYEQEELALHFNPKLADFLFDDNGVASFTLLSCCKVTYHNPARKATFGTGAARIKRIVLPDTGAVIEGDTLRGAAAEGVREGRVKNIEIWME